MSPTTWLHHADTTLFLHVNAFARHTPWLHAPILAYATYGVGLFAALILATLVTVRNSSNQALAATGWTVLGTLAALAVNQPLGHLFAERRPYAAHPGILRLASVSTDFSFPSDHAVMAGAIAAGLLMAHRRLGLVAAVAAAVMAFARVYIAAHYPWDVAAGLLVGAAITLLGWLLLHVPLTLLTGWLRRQPVLRSLFAAPPARPTDRPQPAADRLQTSA